MPRLDGAHKPAGSVGYEILWENVPKEGHHTEHLGESGQGAELRPRG